MTDDEATPEGTPASDMFAELSEGSELVQQEVLPAVREVQQYIASQRDIQDELQRSIESERKFRGELERRSSSGAGFRRVTG